MSAHDSNFFLKTRVFADGKGESRLDGIDRDNFQKAKLIRPTKQSWPKGLDFEIKLQTPAAALN